MHKTVQDAFFSYGWLLPLLLPATQVTGRGITNTLWATYLVWALIAVNGAQARIERGSLLVYLALPVAYLCSVPGAADLSAALHAWVKFTLHSLVFLFTLLVLSSRPQAVHQMLRCAGYAGLLLLAALLAHMSLTMTQPGFEPALILLEDNLPFLTPFMLALLWNNFDSRVRVALMAIITLAISGYVVYSSGRAALLGLAVALFISMPFIAGIRPLRALLVSTALLIGAIAISSATFFRDDHGAPPEQNQESALLQTLDRFTSYRTNVWRQAIADPPSNVATGVGMANVRLVKQVTTVEIAGEGRLRVRHLHNFILDAWYETGLIGLSALLVFLACPLSYGLRRLRTGGEPAVPIGLILASVSALLVSGLLSFSYTSRQFALYLPMLLAALWYLSAHTPNAEQPRT